MIGPALQGAQLISNIGRIAPWALTGASMLPGAVNAAGRFLNQPPAPYNPGGGGMGGRRGTSGTSGGTTAAKPAGSLRDYGPGYKEAELAAGAAAEAFRPGAGFPGQQAAADLAYQQEVSRVAQLTAQNPELQRYEKASKAAKTQEEMDAARDIGMAIWAKANPKLAAKVKPGQSGYEVIQNELNAGQMGPVTDLPFDATKPFSPTPIPPEQLNVTYQSASPVPIPGAQPPAPQDFGRPKMQFFETYRQAIAPGPQFQGSPLAIAPETVVTAYKAELLNPLGGPLTDGTLRSDIARQMAEFYKKAQLGQ